MFMYYKAIYDYFHTTMAGVKSYNKHHMVLKYILSLPVKNEFADLYFEGC